MHIGQLLSRAARHYPLNTAWFEGNGKVVSYAEADRRVTRMASALRRLGLETGDRVGMLLNNGPQALETMLATMRAGLVIVPLNVRLHPDEHIYILNDAGCSTLIYDSQFAPTVAGLRSKLPSLQTTVAVGQLAEGDRAYDDLLSLGSESLDVQPGPADLAWLFYTSGTTGSPKGVMLTHRSLLNMVSINLVDLNTPKPGDVLLHALPISFAGGLFMLHHVACGVTHIFLPRFDPTLFFEAVEQHRVTTTALVPTMISMLARSPERASHDLSSLHTLFYGGAPMHSERLREALDAFGPVLLQSYGLGEAPLTVSVLPKHEHLGPRAQSAGRPVTMVSLRIQDDDWNPLSPGATGEIAVRGELLMQGYWNRPDATADVLKDGWFRTGDIGSIDEEGFLFISDRKKDLIKSGGASISPREVEEIITLHPSVQEVAVIGVPDELWGEAIKALVVLRQGADTTEDELISFCKDRLASFKKPKSVEFVAELPRGGTNKILRRTLRERYWQGQSRSI
jgi:acyl-CoA synthetase (AMP-forming)/AMP-acid ligase II